MNTLDDLRTSLDAYADRGDARDPEEVWAAAAVGDHLAPDAREAARRRPLALVAVALLALLLGTVAVVRLRSDEVGVVTTPTPAEAPAPALAPIVVPDGTVRDVDVAFDRVWVGTDSAPVPGAARLRSFDLRTGDLVSDLPIAGTLRDLVSTDESIFVRLEQVPDLPARPDEGRPWNAAVLRVDPPDSRVVDTVPLDGAGPITATGSQVAFSDTSHLHLVDGATDARTQVPIRDAVGHENQEPNEAELLATYGFTGLAIGPDGLFGKYAKGNELVQMDPATGAHVATQVVEDGAEPIGPMVAAADGYVWSPGTTTVYGVPTPIGSPPELPGERRTVVGTAVSDLAPLGERFVAVLATQAVVGGDPERDDLRTTLDAAATSRIIDNGGEPWVAQWNEFAEGPETIVSFVRVRTDDSMPGGAPPATMPPPVLTVLTTGPLEDGDDVPIGAVGLPAGVDVTLRVCLADDDLCDHASDPEPLPVVRVGHLAGHGELFTTWTARRIIDDDRRHDCSVEACVLRIYGVDADGRLDASTVLAEAPLTFG